MKHFLTLSLCFLSLSLSAQETITYPYNPDGDADGLVAVPDLQDILSGYGNPFSPAEIMVGDTGLSEWIHILSQALEDQQEALQDQQGLINQLQSDYNLLPGGIFSGDILIWNGTAWIPESTTIVEHGIWQFNPDSSFVVPEGITTILLEVNGASGGSGGNIYYDGPWNNDYYGYGGGGGGSPVLRLLLTNLSSGDEITINEAMQGVNSEQLLEGQSCGTGCYIYIGPGETGGTGDDTSLKLNGEVIAFISGAGGGGGACYGCPNQIVTNGSGGSAGNAEIYADWIIDLGPSNNFTSGNSNMTITY